MHRRSWKSSLLLIALASCMALLSACSTGPATANSAAPETSPQSNALPPAGDAGQ
jgi:uncharacterized lipoprotein YajG